MKTGVLFCFQYLLYAYFLYGEKPLLNMPVMVYNKICMGRVKGVAADEL